MSRLTIENRRECPSCRDQLFFSQSRFLKLRLFSRDFDTSRFLSRLSRHVQIVKICQDALRLLRFVETQSRFVEKSQHCRGLLSLKMMKSLGGMRNLDEKIQKSTHFSIEIETNCWETPKFSDLDEFLDLDWDFLWTLMLRRNQEFSISIEISRLRLTFLKCRDKFFEMLRSRVLIKTTSRQIETPRLNTISSPLTSCICLFMCSLAGNKN